MKYLLFLLLVFLFPIQSHSQSIPQVYFHTDRGAYFPGDTVWFKAYVLTEGQLDHDILNLYLQMGTGAGTVIQKSVLLVSAGVSQGNFVVPRDVAVSELFLNAYTAAIIDHPELYYVKGIPIIQSSNQQRPIASQTAGKFQSTKLTVYPEGGVLLEGVENNLLIKAVDPMGVGVPITGRLTDLENKASIAFTTDSNGFASIGYTPSNTDPFKLFWTMPDGNETMQEIKAPFGDCSVLLSEAGDSLQLRVQSNRATPIYAVEARLNYRELFVSSIRFDSTGQKDIYIKKSDLEHGVLQVFLRDSKDVIVSKAVKMTGEISNIQLKPTVEWLEQSKQEKGRNVFKLSLPRTQYTHLSVSITDIDLPVDSLSNITSDLLIKPFIAIENLSWQTLKASDLFLDRQLRSQVRTLPFTNWYTIPVIKDSLLYLKGQIKMSKNKWPKFYERYTKLNSKSKSSSKGIRGASFGYKQQGEQQMIYTEVYPDSLGSFSIPGLTFQDSLETRFSQIYKDLKFEDYQIDYRFSDVRDVSELYLPTFTSFIDSTRVYSSGNYYYGQDYYIDNKGVRYIREVPINRSVEQRRLDELDQKYAHGHFKHAAEFVFDPHSDPQVQKLSIMLKDYLKTKLRRNYKGESISIFLNERELQDQMEREELLDTDMSEIVYIKYYDVFIWASNKPAIVIYKLAPDEINREFGAQIFEETVGGYLGGRYFENKVYKNIADRSSSAYDFRPTLYWNPMLIIDNYTQSQTIEFYNNSRAKGYWITIQGINHSGDFVYFQDKIKHE